MRDDGELDLIDSYCWRKWRTRLDGRYTRRTIRSSCDDNRKICFSVDIMHMGDLSSGMVVGILDNAETIDPQIADIK